MTGKYQNFIFTQWIFDCASSINRNEKIWINGRKNRSGFLKNLMINTFLLPLILI